MTKITEHNGEYNVLYSSFSVGEDGRILIKYQDQDSNRVFYIDNEYEDSVRYLLGQALPVDANTTDEYVAEIVNLQMKSKYMVSQIFLKHALELESMRMRLSPEFDHRDHFTAVVENGRIIQFSGR